MRFAEMLKITLIVIITAAISVGASFVTIHEISKDQIQSSNQKIEVLQKQIAELGTRLEKVSGESSSNMLSLAEIERRQQARSVTQEEMLTSVVAKATPSVVSIVISKDRPSLKILQYARDETHRFGVAYNRAIRKNQIK